MVGTLLGRDSGLAARMVDASCVAEHSGVAGSLLEASHCSMLRRSVSGMKHAQHRSARPDRLHHPLPQQHVCSVTCMPCALMSAPTRISWSSGPCIWPADARGPRFSYFLEAALGSVCVFRKTAAWRSPASNKLKWCQAALAGASAAEKGRLPGDRWKACGPCCNFAAAQA